MTNAEKYLKDGVDAEEFARIILEETIFNPSEEDIIDFLNKPWKPTLTEDERVILRNICYAPLKDFYIERKHGTLKIHNRVDELHDFFAYDHLFRFIKERRRILY